VKLHKLSKVLRWAPFVVVAVELVLLFAGVIDVAEAAVAIVVLEAALAVILIGEAATLWSAYGKARRSGGSRASAASAALDAALPPVMARLVKTELSMMASLGGIFGRRDASGEPGETVVPYGSNLRTLLKALIVISILEIVVVGIVVELFVSSAVIRWGLLIVSVYMFVWAVAFTSAMRRRPHVVGPEQLRLRFGTLTDIPIPTRLIGSVRADREGSHKRILNIDDDTLSLAIMGTTNMVAELDEPYDVDLGHKGVHTVRRVRFHADRSDAATKAIREAVANAAHGGEDDADVELPRPQVQGGAR
jgi:hypothetical protein